MASDTQKHIDYTHINSMVIELSIDVVILIKQLWEFSKLTVYRLEIVNKRDREHFCLFKSTRPPNFSLNDFETLLRDNHKFRKLFYISSPILPRPTGSACILSFYRAIGPLKLCVQTPTILTLKIMFYLKLNIVFLMLMSRSYDVGWFCAGYLSLVR